MPQVPVAQLKDYIGKELGHSEWLTIDQQRVAQIEALIELEGDEFLTRLRDAKQQNTLHIGA